MNPNRIFIIGLPGAGKTFAGKALAEQLRFPFYDLDALVEEQSAQTISTIFDEVGEDGFRKREAEALRSFTQQAQQFVMACGGGTPCFNENMEFMNAHGLTIYLTEPIEIIAQRLAKEKAHRPLIAKLDAGQLQSYLVDLKAKREPFYLQAKLIVDDVAQIADKIKLFSFETLATNH